MKIIGHRGWRGKFPENALLGFQELCKQGVLAVELDVVVTKDNQLLVSHEPWFDGQYCESEFARNFYRLTAQEIQKTDCGSRLDARFPEQLKTKTIKPLFKDLIALWDKLGVKPMIALEVKSESHLYGSYQPFPEAFAQLLIDFENTYLQGFDYFVQSFDSFFLKTYHAMNPTVKTGLLVEYKADVEIDLQQLGYIPNYYNPEHVLLNDVSVKKITEQGCQIFTWTVNKIEDYNRIKKYPLLGVITDYPERF